MISLSFAAEEEGIDGVYQDSDIQFAVLLGIETQDQLLIEGEAISLKRMWENSGVKDGEALTEIAFSGKHQNGDLSVNVELLEIGCARASISWSNSVPTREIIGFCDNWKVS